MKTKPSTPQVTKEQSPCPSGTTVTVDLPDELWAFLELLTEQEGLSGDEGLDRMLERMQGLDPAELHTFTEPPVEDWRPARVTLSRPAFFALKEFSKLSGLSPSGICRRILWGFAVTREIVISWSSKQQKSLLQRA